MQLTRQSLRPRQKPLRPRQVRPVEHLALDPDDPGSGIAREG